LLGKCSFDTDKFSLFSLAEEVDETPEVFSFTDIIDSELNTENISNTIAVS
jgi:hypothetical protein